MPSFEIKSNDVTCIVLLLRLAFPSDTPAFGGLFIWYSNHFWYGVFVTLVNFIESSTSGKLLSPFATLSTMPRLKFRLSPSAPPVLVSIPSIASFLKNRASGLSVSLSKDFIFSSLNSKSASVKSPASFESPPASVMALSCSAPTSPAASDLDIPIPSNPVD